MERSDCRFIGGLDTSTCPFEPDPEMDNRKKVEPDPRGRPYSQEIAFEVVDETPKRTRTDP